MNARQCVGDRRVVLVTGMSGSGKSAALTQLARRGHAVVDTDDPGWIIRSRAGGGSEPMWDVDRIASRIDRHRFDRHRIGSLFLAGCVANQGEMYERFDAIVLLSAPIEVLLARVAARANPFGSAAQHRAQIAADHEQFEPVLPAGASHEVVTTAPIAEVVLDLERIAASCKVDK